MKSNRSEVHQQEDRKRFAARKGDFLKAVRADPVLKPASKLVAHSLLDHLNFGDTCVFPSINTIARETGINESSARRGIEDLQSGGWLVVSPRWKATGDRTSNEFRPVWERMNRKPPAEPEFVWASGVIQLRPEQYATLEKHLVERLPAFLRMIENRSPEWTPETWTDQVNALLTEWLEPEPF